MTIEQVRSAATPEELQDQTAESSCRFSGILVHPTSFPSPFGIGDLGKGAYDFIDFLAASGQKLWQVLPLGPTGFGDSPYQGPSAFAGQPLIISPEKLFEKGLLTREDLETPPHQDPHKVDYGTVIPYKYGLLRRAYATFRHTPDKLMLEEFEHFCAQEKDWLDDYALFMALKEAHEGRCWLDWEEAARTPDEKAKKAFREQLHDEISFHCFVQFIFQMQWTQLLSYAHSQHVEVIGDAPIFMSLDSCDVWANKKYFQLDTKGFPTHVAGVPPDYFSATGQLWGNPLYDWDAMKKAGYSWWIERVRRQLELVDHLRIDHFRGFESYWSVPAGEETAIHGSWKKGPGADLFRTIAKALGENLPIFAEDLGIITPEVEALREELGFPGMKVLQFGFGDMNDRSYIPHFYTDVNCLCYTGTHDNDTTAGWYQSQPEQIKDRIRRYGNTDGGCISLDFIRFCLGSIAKYAIFPIQDLLMLGSEARMNTPGVAAANWSFRYTADMLTPERSKWLAQTTSLFGR